MASLLTLTIMEIILGIDNIIFISILAGKLPESQRDKARKFGLTGAMVTRLLLLFMASWIIQLKTALFTVAGIEITGKGLILLAGGLFLLYKATSEIHSKVEQAEGSSHGAALSTVTLRSVLIQILIMDTVFSIDSVITAVGMTQSLLIMFIANILALIIMLLAAKGISDFVDAHPTVKVLALAFLILIGTMLVAEAFHFEVPKGYIYFAMGFSAFVEFINMKIRTKQKPVS